VFVPGKLFQPSLMFVGKARGHPRVEHLKGASLGQARSLLANIGVGWKSLPGKNTLAYYKNPLITAVISFIV
jgi:hypothetical protein